MTNVIDLPRITDLNDFYEGYFKAAKPVVVEGAARLMGAFSKWTDEYLVAALGDERPKVRLADGRFARLPITDFLKYLANPDAFQSSSGPIYLTDYYIRPHFDEPGRAALSLDVFCPLPRGGHFAEWMTMYAGPKGTCSPMHQDMFSTHTWLAQLRGEKTWRLCAPSDLPEDVGNSVDAFNDQLDCPVYEGILNAGDIIYLPPNWWHQVRNMGSSTLSISGNFCSFDEAEAVANEVKQSQRVNFREAWLPIWNSILSAEAKAAF